MPQNSQHNRVRQRSQIIVYKSFTHVSDNLFFWALSAERRWGFWAWQSFPVLWERRSFSSARGTRSSLGNAILARRHRILLILRFFIRHWSNVFSSVFLYWPSVSLSLFAWRQHTGCGFNSPVMFWRRGIERARRKHGNHVNDLLGSTRAGFNLVVLFCTIAGALVPIKFTTQLSHFKLAHDRYTGIVETSNI